ncbi:leucine-rich repeat domain-containing protein [Konateibacter massiliensis]|uniref:leucine-rich repeat domain-containing protein n=1 Tax=Konateibacter massiliensis TaxID=2002841 RepID=UPI000C158EF0|nr:leucine-rich repeat domain-containing protein [Konateibacter massiliensis]
MKNLIKKLLVVTMALALVSGGLTPVGNVGVVQAEETSVTSGQCGKTAYWNYDTSSKTLTISGTGSTYNYVWDYDKGESTEPWAQYKESIKKVVVKKGITGIGNRNFNSLYKVTSISLPKTLTKIGNYSFVELDSLKKLVIPDSVKTIGNNSISNTGLTNITLGSSLTKVGNYSICDFSQKAVKIKIKSKKLKSIGKGSLFVKSYFNNTKLKTQKVTIQIPSSKLNSYKKMIQSADKKYLNERLKRATNEKGKENVKKWYVCNRVYKAY